MRSTQLPFYYDESDTAIFAMEHWVGLVTECLSFMVGQRRARHDFDPIFRLYQCRTGGEQNPRILHDSKRGLRASFQKIINYDIKYRLGSEADYEES
jgi:hypothetical protein